MTFTTLLDNAFGSIKQRKINEDISAITISHRLGDAVISLYGGQVLSWQPKNQQPVFWLSDNAQYIEGKAIRGGIPLCWPWFGAFKGDNQEVVNSAGNHGFARQRTWQVSLVELDAKQAKIVLSLTGKNECENWPEKYLLQQELIFSETFAQKLVMTNLSENPMQYSGALHSYFSVSHPENIEINSLDEALFDDKLTGKVKVKDKLSHCIGPIDRIYHSSQRQEIIDHEWQRKIIVCSTNCQQWVLWNPGKDIAEGMADIHLGGENEYVCLEAANTQWQTILPKGASTIKQQIVVKSG